MVLKMCVATPWCDQSKVSRTFMVDASFGKKIFCKKYNFAAGFFRRKP